MDDTWSAQDEATLVQLVGTETKYRIIGELLGRSVNAVCAKVKRMRDLREIPETVVRVLRHTPRIPRSTECVDDQQAINYQEFDAAMKTLAREAEVKTDLLTLEDLPDNGCHFVIGDPKHSARVYCSCTALPGQSYCSEHYRRVYNPTPTSVPVFRPIVAPERVLELA